MSMGGRWLVLAVALAACKGKDGGPTDDTTYPFECEVVDPYDLPDPWATVEGHEHDCEDQPLYDPDVPTATSYFVGEFHFDECGTVYGKETWVLYPNQRWLDTGGKQCQVVWSVTGTKEERVTIGNYSLNLGMTVDEAASDCTDIPYFDYEDVFAVVYDVAVQGDASTVYFTSGTVLGEGTANNNHVTYVSGMNCKLF